MKGIRITYSVDRESWTDAQFEDQESKEFVITTAILEELIRQTINFADDEEIYEIEDIKIIN